MNGGIALQSLRGTLQGGDAPVAHFIEVDIERWLVELDDVHASGFDSASFLIQDLRESPRQLFPAPVVSIIERVDHGHRARKRELHLSPGLAAQEGGVLDVDWVGPRHRTHDYRNVCIVTVTNAHRLLVLKIDALEVLDQRRDEVPAGLLAVGDDVD